MARDRKGLRAVVREISQSADRSTLFWWLVTHHDDLVEAGDGRRLQWVALSALRGARVDGPDWKPASEEVARLTWHRVRKAVAAERARQREKPPRRPDSVFPSRIPKDWRPQVVPPTELSSAAGSTLVPSQSRSPRIEGVGPRPSPIDMSAPPEFPTVDLAGNPLEEGWVFYRGKVMTRHAAEQLEQISRAFREKDRGV